MGPKRGGSRAPRGRGGRGGKAVSGPDAPAWLRGSGGVFSAKAKKEYLQWKRQQKAARADGSGSDEGEEGQLHDEELQETARFGKADHHSDDHGDHADEGESSEVLSYSEGEDVSGSGSASGDDAGSDAGPGSGRGAGAARARAAGAAAAREHAADARNKPPCAEVMEAPLVYQPLEEVGGLASAPGAEAGDQRGAAGVQPAAACRMVRLSEAEVGQTEEGRALGMPTRPEWQVRGSVARAAADGWRQRCSGTEL